MDIQAAFRQAQLGFTMGTDEHCEGDKRITRTVDDQENELLVCLQPLRLHNRGEFLRSKFGGYISALPIIFACPASSKQV